MCVCIGREPKDQADAEPRWHQAPYFATAWDAAEHWVPDTEGKQGALGPRHQKNCRK